MKYEICAAHTHAHQFTHTQLHVQVKPSNPRRAPFARPLLQPHHKTRSQCARGPWQLGNWYSTGAVQVGGEECWLRPLWTLPTSTRYIDVHEICQITVKQRGGERGKGEKEESLPEGRQLQQGSRPCTLHVFALCASVCEGLHLYVCMCVCVSESCQIKRSAQK